MKQDYATKPIVKVGPLKKWDIRTIRFLITCALITMLIFVIWFARPEHIGCGPLFWLLCIGLIFKLVKMLHEWYHYWSLSIPVMPQSNKTYAVDVLTTACPGEPQEMIINTLKAMVAITYPHKNYLCDEGNDPVLKKVCMELGVIHVTREIKTNAKAGNINNALNQATGEICVVLDPDHIPIPEFLDRVLPYFEDQSIGYVQCVQGYYNQNESIIAKGAAEQTYHFYGPMMMCMNTYGTVQAIGANCTFRRIALDSIGGHAPGLAEDMHTAMQLHAKGWKSIYVPEMLTKGLVPATLSAYYKQQLKWSRGTFELLFHTYPTLCKNFTWRQKIHYLCIPLYFLFGLINLIDFLIPLLALGLAEVPWEVDIENFAVLFIPLCTLSMVIRLFAQRWVLEKHERGLHLAGGILRTATWWIFLIGFIYSIFNIKVPYIPTPKEDVHENYWRLSLPNFLIIIFCAISIYYGLSIDWSPYSMAMAFYGLINVLILGYIVIMSQQQLLETISVRINSIHFLRPLIHFVSWIQLKIKHGFHSLVQSGPVVLLIAIALVFLSYNNISSDEDISETQQERNLGGFYAGCSNVPGTSGMMHSLEKNIHRNFDIITLRDTLGTFLDSTELAIQKIYGKGCIPLMNWHLPKNANHQTDWEGIINSKYDPFLTKYAAMIRSYSSPIFFNPILFKEGDSLPDSPELVQKSWQYLHSFFNHRGISNICWVWTPQSLTLKDYYPGFPYVDWIGIKTLNNSNDPKAANWHSFSDLYNVNRPKLRKLDKPILVMEFGSIKGNAQDEWFNSAFNYMKDIPEINGVIFYNHQPEHNALSDSWASTNFSIEGETVDILKEKFAADPFKEKPFYKHLVKKEISDTATYKSPFVKGTPRNFELLINKKPYYIQGVAYNTGHDWRDGNTPLTRRQLERDFKHIKEMGANTIRRYSHSMYDKNVLNVAAEYDLKVQYGFWFDPKVDYYRDSARVNEYIEDAVKKVQEFKDHPAVLAWSIGNETWGLLKKKYTKPYLTTVRACYMNMIETIANRIHEIDPSRPVFSSMEHEEYQLTGEVVAFHDHVPSVDVIGINSYYKQQISELNNTFYTFDSLRPYLVSEFGPNGYWEPRYNKTFKGSRMEDDDHEKAKWYQFQWNHYVAGYKGYNVGGFAYCWLDRLEGSYTWFGLSDYRGRLKPSYYALKEIWTKQKTEPIPSVMIEMPERIIPGRECQITTLTNALPGKTYHYEWLLLKDEYLEKIDNIEPSANGRSVKLLVPGNASNYRLYLFVSDENQHVTTSSIPITVN